MGPFQLGIFWFGFSLWISSHGSRPAVLGTLHAPRKAISVPEKWELAWAEHELKVQCLVSSNGVAVFGGGFIPGTSKETLNNAVIDWLGFLLWFIVSGKHLHLWVFPDLAKWKYPSGGDPETIRLCCSHLAAALNVAEGKRGRAEEDQWWSIISHAEKWLWAGTGCQAAPAGRKCLPVACTYSLLLRNRSSENISLWNCFAVRFFSCSCLSPISSGYSVGFWGALQPVCSSLFCFRSSKGFVTHSGNDC